MDDKRDIRDLPRKKISELLHLAGGENDPEEDENNEIDSETEEAN